MEKKALVIGFGVSGQSVIPLLQTKGFKVDVTDQNIIKALNHPKAAFFQSQNVLFLEPKAIQASDYEMVILSPGVKNNDEAYVVVKQSNVKIYGELQWALMQLKPIRLVGITGTNGKTTVTMMIDHILNQSGVKSAAVGNLGFAVSEFALHQNDEQVAVVELSSYQLDTLINQSFDAVALLNITPDHLDRYHTMEAYAASKFHIFDLVKPNGLKLINENCIETWKDFFNDSEIKIFGMHNKNVIKTDLKHIILEENIETILPLEYRGRYSHNLENVLAAFGICRYLGVSPQQFISGLESFKKPKYRIEFVRKHLGVDYYDDSKGTNLDAVMKAVESFKEPIVLIAGGVHKGCSYKTWIESFKGRVKSIHAIGESANLMAQELVNEFPTYVHSSLEKAVRAAASQATQGDVVLLSPGCASTDMFRDYAHRGDEFKKIVASL